MLGKGASGIRLLPGGAWRQCWLMVEGVWKEMTPQRSTTSGLRPMADHGLALYQECMISRVLGVRNRHTL